MDQVATSIVPSADTLLSNFRAAVEQYEAAYSELRAKKGQPRDQLMPIVRLVQQRNQECSHALDMVIASHKDGALLKQYLDAGKEWTARVELVTSLQQDPLSPQNRRESQPLFMRWKEAEQHYAQAGYRTIGKVAWFDAATGQPGKVAYQLWSKVLIVLQPGETAERPALEIYRKVGTKLRIGGNKRR